MIKRIKESIKQRREVRAFPIFIKKINEITGPCQNHQSLKHLSFLLFSLFVFFCVLFFYTWGVLPFAERRSGVSGYVKCRAIDRLIWN